MKKYRRLLPLPALLVTAFLGCVQTEYPYLFVDVNSVYRNNHINISYAFESENESQRCKVTVVRDNDGEIVYSDDRWFYKEGDLHFELENGFYTLTFIVLSERGGRYYELPFLSEEYSFSIQKLYSEEGT